VSTQVIPADGWAGAIVVLARGRVVAIPTDTVYGIAAMPLDPSAIDAVYAAKDRPVDKALPMLVSGIAVAERISVLNDPIRRLCHRFWPGPLTITAPATSVFPTTAMADDGTIALRMPALDLALEIIAAAGGVLAVTSANRSGEPPALTAREVLQQLDGRITAVVDGGASPLGTPSTVVSLHEGHVEILRQGAITAAEIEQALVE
jgi:L-threonylcarbamoyladenylate synthase